MRLSHYFSRYILLIIVLLFCAVDLYANDNLEKKVKKLTLELRCMTCQNQSIYDSEAEFSNDIKKIVKNKFKEGMSEREIKQFLVSRYGEYILLKPLLNYKNMFLWAFPFILLTFGLFFMMSRMRK